MNATRGKTGQISHQTTKTTRPWKQRGSECPVSRAQRPQPGAVAMTVIREDSDFIPGRTLLLCSGPDPGCSGTETREGEGRHRAPAHFSLPKPPALGGTSGKGCEFEIEV